MPTRRLALPLLCATLAACTVSPIPSSPRAPSDSGSETDAVQVREVVDRHFSRLYAAEKVAPVVDVASVDVTGEVAAAKVVEMYPAEVRVEYVNLSRARGVWRIVNTVSTRVTR